MIRVLGRVTGLALGAAMVFGGVGMVGAQSQLYTAGTAKAIQLELNRLGCEAGTADGIWGRGSKAALSRYATAIGAATLGTDPTDALLQTLRGERGRLCTLPPGIVAAENRSDTAHLEAVKFSYTIWTTMPSRVATEQTEYGTLRCEAGSNSSARKCAWQ